ncbi:putative myb-like transcription factor [Helianthus annuus]|nr:putative Myb domain-containing protein [Helianthus annuus]KAJ0738058.1 putative Myb domain-containing protein [Helianthus annuus]KAJ0915622.1 putative myb-like transcription factor [Helianthus annuus]
MSNINSNHNNNGEPQKQQQQKERHIVSWSQEEDDILRQQIGIHGTDK